MMNVTSTMPTVNVAFHSCRAKWSGPGKIINNTIVEKPIKKNSKKSWVSCQFFAPTRHESGRCIITHCQIEKLPARLSPSICKLYREAFRWRVGVNNIPRRPAKKFFLCKIALPHSIKIKKQIFNRSSYIVDKLHNCNCKKNRRVFIRNVLQPFNADKECRYGLLKLRHQLKKLYRLRLATCDPHVVCAASHQLTKSWISI